MAPVLPAELIDDILTLAVPSWNWGYTWKDKRLLKANHARISWFFNLRLVNRMFNAVVLDLFVAAVKAGDVPGLPVSNLLDTDSTMAMGRRVLGHAVWQFVGDWCATRKIRDQSPYRFVNTIVQTVERAVELFHDTDRQSRGEGGASAEEIREAYTEGAIAAQIGLNGEIVLGDQRCMDDWNGETDASRAVLMIAAYLGRHDHVERLLDLGLDVNTNLLWKSIWSPVMAACLAGRVETLEFLLERGADLHVLAEGTGTMEMAARGGHAQVVEFLLGKNVTVNDEEGGSPPLVGAAAGGHLAVVKLLLERPDIDLNGGDSWPPPALIWAVQRGHEDIVLELLTRDDIDVNVTDLDLEVKGVTGLAIAGVLGSERIFNILFDHPRADRASATVLQFAIEGGNLSIVKRILDTVTDMLEIFRRVRIERPCVVRRETALCRAAEAGIEEIVRYLLSIDKEPINYQDERTRTALHHAVNSGVPGTVRALLDHPKMDDECFRLVDRSEQSCLHYAAKTPHQNADILQMLLNHPATEVNARDNSGKTPLATAAWYGAVDMVRTLLDRDDVLIHTLDSQNRSPFINAAMGGSEEVIRILSKVPGTEFWRKDEVNRTALQWAVRNNNENVVKTLLLPEFGATDEIIRQALWDSETWLTELQQETIQKSGPLEEWCEWEVNQMRKMERVRDMLSKIDVPKLVSREETPQLWLNQLL
ncbi:ankyrin repeat-containing domain protein [Aspergillus germanicus]